MGKEVEKNWELEFGQLECSRKGLIKLLANCFHDCVYSCTVHMHGE